MPKMKTHKGTAKRFKVTKSGRVRRRKCGSGHLMSHKSGKKLRHLRQPCLVEGKKERTLKRLLGLA